MNKYIRILTSLVPYWGYLLVSLVLTLIYLAANIFAMPLARDIITVISEAKFDQINHQLLLIIVLFGIRQICESSQAFLMGYVGTRIRIDWQVQLFKKLTQLSLTFHTNAKVGDLLSRLIGDVGLVSDALMRNIQKVVPQTLTLIGVIVYLLFQDWQLTIMAILVLPLVIGVIVLFGQKMKRISYKIQSITGDYAHIGQEVLNHIRVVKGFGRENYEVTRFRHVNLKALKQSIKIMICDHGSVIIVALLQLIAIVAVMTFGIYRVMHGRLETAELSQFVVGVALILDPLNTLSSLYKITLTATAGADRVFEVLDQDLVISEPEKPLALTTVTESVSFESVSFQYPHSTQWALRDVSLSVKAGQVVAFVGASGAGKSTMINLLPRFYDATEGRIMIDGVDISHISLQALRAMIGIVPQESVLFTGTIAENLRYGKLSATQEELEQAARQANAWHFISALPNQFETYLGDRGHRLSGGQKQRLSIARAILKNPKILILDEATSSLDSESEQLVQEALANLMCHRTTFVIAHRLSTIMQADRIVVFKEGCLVEQGLHDELIQKKGIYRRFYELQYR